jgi:hypothetical protein
MLSSSISGAAQTGAERRKLYLDPLAARDDIDPVRTPAARTGWKVSTGLARLILLVGTTSFAAVPANAHGLAGKRFFPATVATDDPFVADELSLPTISYQKMSASGDAPATSETDFSIDMSKRITENLGIGVGVTYKQLRPDGGDKLSGFDNLAAQVKYKLFQSDEHEAILSIGADVDVGNTGAKRIAESLTTVTPTLFFGKGLGDLPQEMKFLRPFAVTGTLGVSIPSRTSTTITSDSGDVTVNQNPNFLQWGLAIEYSLPYLQAYVQDLGLGAPFNRMIPVVEFPMSTGLNRGAHGTTGTVNPGIIWAGQYVQLTVEAVIPINRASGSHTGVIAQLHFYLDDIFPNSLGKPIFGN